MDEDGRVLPPGKYGQLVITTIGMEALPLIRYRTGDYTRILPGVCPCGSQTVRLDRLDRRPQGTEITALDNALLSLEGLVDFRAECSGKCLKIDALCKGPVKKAELLRRAEQLFPAYEIGVVLREAEESDRCLYRGKRCIMGNDTENFFAKVETEP